MKKKALIIASVASMIEQFNMPNIELLQELEYEVVVACNFIKGSTCSDQKIEELKRKLEKKNIRYFQIDFSRNTYNVGSHYKSYIQIKKLIKKENFNVIHCHSPIGALLTRLAARKERLKGTRVIYTAHGFHFYKGAPKINWLIYYPIEKLCAKWTDVLITINTEDYEFAKRKIKAQKVEYIPGIGIDVDKFKNTVVDRTAKRKELGIPEKAFLLLSVGELNKNKNHEIIVKAIAQIENKNIHYAIAGRGTLYNYISDIAENLDVKERVHLLGYRTDVNELYKISDVFCFPSIREGLPVALMEAMASGLKIIVSDNRGTKDLLDTSNIHCCCKFNDLDGFIKKISDISNSMYIDEEYDLEAFRIESVISKTKDIYLSNT